MAKWKVTPEWKKSILEVQEWVRPGESGYISHEIGWRWGEFIVETEDDNPPPIEEDVNMFDLPEGCSCDDWSTDDGCWEETDIDIPDEELKEKIEEFLSENSIYDLESEGWVMSDCYMYINCPVTIEKVEDDE